MKNYFYALKEEIFKHLNQLRQPIYIFAQNVQISHV
jgi:hypothetical protein